MGGPALVCAVRGVDKPRDNHWQRSRIVYNPFLPQPLLGVQAGMGERRSHGHAVHPGGHYRRTQGNGDSKSADGGTSRDRV